jgi:glycogen phosphorylase
MTVPNLPQTGLPARPRHHARTPTGYGKEEIKVLTSSIPSKARGLWKNFSFHKFETKEDFEREVVRHVNTTLARSMFNFDDFAAYHATALAMRDRLLVAWNETHQAYATKDPKRVYCMSSFDCAYNRSVIGVSDGTDFG